jgi:hypothetical protein
MASNIMPWDIALDADSVRNIGERAADVFADEFRRLIREGNSLARDAARRAGVTLDPRIAKMRSEK